MAWVAVLSVKYRQMGKVVPPLMAAALEDAARRYIPILVNRESVVQILPLPTHREGPRCQAVHNGRHLRS